ncbi:MAG: TetR/AcrR family transcriptional regulator [Myxococcota bacterium]
MGTKRGRPARFDTAQAVEVAMRQIWAVGYDQFTIDALCQELGISPPSLYHRFGSKADLCKAAVELYNQRNGEQVGAILAVDFEDPVALARAFLTATAATFSANKNRQGCMLLDGVRPSKDPAVRPLVDAEIARTKRQLKSLLRRSGFPHAKAGADYLMAALIGLSGLAKSGASSAALRKTAMAMAEGLGALGDPAKRASPGSGRSR